MAITKYISNLARALLGKPYEDLSRREQNVIEALASGEPIAENVNEVFREQLSLGGRVADALARIAGSWGFIIGFVVLLVSWMLLNSAVLIRYDADFDPYPYILLNLALSSLAAFQAPFIMMSQNRQAEKDRISAANAFEVNLKTELAIQQLHGKVDAFSAGEQAPSDAAPQA